MAGVAGVADVASAAEPALGPGGVGTKKNPEINDKKCLDRIKVENIPNYTVTNGLVHAGSSTLCVCVCV